MDVGDGVGNDMGVNANAIISSDNGEAWAVLGSG